MSALSRSAQGISRAAVSYTHLDVYKRQGCREGGLTAVLSPQTRKPLVEKKRRARINESLQELRSLLADSECMHEVHTFVSSCPGIDATTAAELLNHLLESMPLSDGGCPDSVTDLVADPTALSPWLGSEALAPALPALAPSPSPSEETCSDSDEAEAEPGQTSTDGLDASQTHGLPSPSLPKSMWRPW
ncbi:transcription cofactor HES-6 [Amazona aestiva]|uniref:Transcription cofactor HES-6 n=1 Tax=Amazona aestiva TaxID=12930 RepID=A0A0Q3PAF5_AMAAE|nr:transcription cofactor HES-6 [Amazona aestiva]